MADYQARTTVSAPEGALFDYLSDVSKLPEYFSRMTEAHRTGETEEVHTAARMPDGQVVEGEAWFRVDESAKRVSWGSPGDNAYSGFLDVTATDGGSEVVVHIHSPRVEDPLVQDGVDETVAAIKEKVEAQGVAQS